MKTDKHNAKKNAQKKDAYTNQANANNMKKDDKSSQAKKSQNTRQYRETNPTNIDGERHPEEQH